MPPSPTVCSPLEALACLGPVAIHRLPGGDGTPRLMVSAMTPHATAVVGLLGHGRTLTEALDRALARTGTRLSAPANRQESACMAHLEHLAPVAVWTGADALGHPSFAVAGLDENSLHPNHEYAQGPDLAACIARASTEAARRERENIVDGRYSLSEEQRVIRNRRALPALASEMVALRGPALPPPGIESLSATPFASRDLEVA